MNGTSKAIAGAALLSWGAGAGAADANIYQMYYVPMPEQTVTDFNNTVNSAGNSMRTVLSISVVLDGTRIWFDQSEDGFESFITVPGQATTGVWGDGDPSNGYPPGFPADTLSAGDVIVLDETYDVTTVGACSYADGSSPSTDCRLNGGDRFGSNKALAVTRAAWNESPGSVLAGALEVEPTAYWSNSYTMPVGEDTGAALFNTVWAVVVAAEDDTQLQLNGGTAVTLQAGESHVFSGVNEGDQITASANVQVNLLTGQNTNYESRWLRVPPVSQWAGEYFSPVGTTTGTDPAYYYLFNPGTSAIDVTVEYAPGTTTTVTVPAGASTEYTGATASGLRFHTAGGEPFYVMGAGDADSSDSKTHDWGFSLVPAAGLTGQTVLGWAPGDEATTNPDYSPVWVTATADTTLCVDFDRDGTVDQTTAVSRLQMIRLTDTSDNDMTGALVYSINDPNGDNVPTCASNGSDDTQTDIAVVWGQDASTAATGSPAIDAGTTVLAVPKYAVSKRAELMTDADGSGNITPGDTIVFRIEVDNYGALPLNNAVLSDDMPPELNFDAGNSNELWDCSGFPVCTLGTFSVSPFSSVTYDLAATIPPGGGTATVVGNTVTLDPGTGDPTTATTAEAPVEYADVTVTLSGPASVAPGGTVTNFVDFGNVGTLNAATTGYGFQLPSGLADVSCVGATCNYDAGTGVVAVSGLPTSLSPGQWTGTVTLSYTAPASGSIPVSATVTTGSLQPTPHAQDTDAATIAVAAGGTEADVVSSVTAPLSAAPGSTVTVPVSYANLGPAAAAGVSYSLTLPAGLSGVGCSGGAAACSYDPGTGVVTVTGLPTTLSAGQSEQFDLSYTAPATGPVVVDSGISTTTTESDGTNNPDVGTTAITSGTTADVTTNVSPPTQANAGETVTVPVSYSNVGLSDAAGIGYDIDLTNSPADIVVSYNGSSCGYDSGSGQVSGCGLPSTLVPGQRLELELTYTAPLSTPVQVTSTVSTSTAETNLDNNVAAAQTGVLVGAITGTVFDDVNGNGVRDGGEGGIAGVTVSLDGGTATTTTDGNGDYSFASVTPGSHTVTETDPTGYVSTGDSDGGANGDNTVAVSVPAGGSSTADFGDQQTGGITGTVFEDTNGNGNRDTGEPGIAGVTVTLDGGVITTTGADGSYAFTDLAPGTYTVTETDPTGYGSTGDSDGGGNGHNTVTVTLTPGAGATAHFGDQALAPDMVIDLTGLPDPAPNAPYTGSFACSNRGTADALSGTVCGVEGLPSGLAVGQCAISPHDTPWDAGDAVPVGETVVCPVTGTPIGGVTALVDGVTDAQGDSEPSNNQDSRSFATAQVPTLSEWAMVILAMLMLWTAARVGGGRLRL